MLEDLYETKLLYVFDHKGTSEVMMELNTDYSISVIKTVIKELHEKDLIKIAETSITLTHKGAAFLELKNKIISTKKPLHEITAGQLALRDALILRDAGLLDDNPPIKKPIIITKTGKSKKNQFGIWVVKIFNKITDSTILLIITILGTVVGALLVIMIVNYCNNKGFVIK